MCIFANNVGLKVPEPGCDRVGRRCDAGRVQRDEYINSRRNIISAGGDKFDEGQSHQLVCSSKSGAQREGGSRRVLKTMDPRPE